MTKTRSFKRLNRQVERKKPRPKIYIYSEGEKTERDYFEEMKRHFRESLVEIEIIEGAGVPLTIAQKVTEAAKSSRRGEKRQSYSGDDKFWAVFDRDEHPNLQKALDMCKGNDIGVAFSNPCFELWLILHFQEFDRPDDRHEVQRHLETICTDYSKSKRKTTDCQKLMDRVADAESRAERQLNSRISEGNPPNPPFTTVYKLTRAIRGYPEKS